MRSTSLDSSSSLYYVASEHPPSSSSLYSAVSEYPPSSASSGSSAPAGSAGGTTSPQHRIEDASAAPAGETTSPKHHVVVDSAASPVKLGTFFSGLETPPIAAKQIGLVTQLGFAIELSKPLREHIVRAWQPEQIHGDVGNVNFLSLPTVDILVGGPPCQPFCHGGLHGGLKDERGALFFSMVACCEQRLAASADLPKALVIENSSFLLSRHREVFRELRSRLQACGYEVRAKVMNTKHNGLPQDRERAYIVALRIVEGRDFRFPVPLGETVPLKHILHEKYRIVRSRPLTSLTNRRNLRTAIRQATQKGYDPEEQNIFVDLVTSAAWTSWRLNVCPCITRARAASAGFYITSRKRRISTAEMLKLQGIRPENMRGHGLSYGVLNAAVGNAMSACILERLLPRIAYAIGCIPERMPDEWCHPGFIAAGGRFGKRKRTGA